jgi:hypothetical protein
MVLRVLSSFNLVTRYVARTLLCTVRKPLQVNYKQIRRLAYFHMRSACTADELLMLIDVIFIDCVGLK